MVFLEIIFVLAGWNYGIFDSSFVYCVDIWDFILCISVCICDFYLCEGASLWGPGRGLAFYRKRWTLETAFRAMKSAGFNMEETHLGVKRFENMLTLLMIAFAAVFIDGLVKIESLPIPMMKSRNVQRISIFRYGYVNLLHDFWANVKNEAAKPT